MRSTLQATSSINGHCIYGLGTRPVTGTRWTFKSN